MDEFLEDFEREGVLSALTKSPAGMFLDPLKIGAQPDRIEQRVSDELDPETKQRLARSVELARRPSAISASCRPAIRPCFSARSYCFTRSWLRVSDTRSLWWSNGAGVN